METNRRIVRTLRTVASIAAAAVALCAAAASPAQAFELWWIDDDAAAVGAARIDGRDAFVALAGQPHPLASLAVTADGVLVAEPTEARISRLARTLAGYDPFVVLAPGTQPRGVAVDAGWVLWRAQAGGDEVVGRAQLGLGVVEPDVLEDGAQLAGDAIAARGGHVFWGAPGGIARARLDGTEVHNGFVPAIGPPAALAADDEHLYWTDSTAGTIGRARLDGSEVEPAFVTGLAGVRGIAVSGRHIFFTRPAAGAIGRADRDGTDVEPSFLAGVGAPTAVGVEPYGVATPSAGSLAFGEAVVDRFGGLRALRIENTGDGPLPIRRIRARGDVRSEVFVTSDDCTGETLAVGASCAVDVRFAPLAVGPRAGALEVETGPVAAPLSVPVSGVGVAPPPEGGQGPQGPQGPGGPQGPQGPQGPGGPQGPAGPPIPGAQGPAGRDGAAGAEGPRGPAGRDGTDGRSVVVTCRVTTRRVRGRARRAQVCTTRVAAGSVDVRTGAAALHRGGRVAARGTARRGRVTLRATSRARLRPGRYVLALARGGSVARIAVRVRS